MFTLILKLSYSDELIIFGELHLLVTAALINDCHHSWSKAYYNVAESRPYILYTECS